MRQPWGYNCYAGTITNRTGERLLIVIEYD